VVDLRASDRAVRSFPRRWGSGRPDPAFQRVAVARSLHL